jgi:holo-[acyl-carrier protein] synthase
MLLGTGVDMIEVERIARSIQRYGERFLRRVFTGPEIDYCCKSRNSAERFAARFAAKEAGAKALGTGMNFGVTWHEIEVRRSTAGRPSLELSGQARRVADRLGVKQISLSLTHTASAAVAIVMMEGGQG